jgi:nitrate/TMAO reductase-like tetraheme cytochrome c subunit
MNAVMLANPASRLPTERKCSSEPMALQDRLPQWFRPVAYFSYNPLTMTGVVLAVSSAFTVIGFWIYDFTTGGTINPYIGVIFILILPGILVIGLFLIPIGAYWHRHRLRAGGKLPTEYPKVDFSRPLYRHAAAWAGGFTILNAVILSVGSYRGVEYMDSANFCGQTCHTVMQPEYTAYLNSPHQRVSCVQCHIGPGAGWFVRSKLSGVRQVVAVTLHNYDHPIPSPVEQLRPARETCEQCHWPLKFTGDKLIIRKKYSDDEKNTPLTTILVMKIGGHNGHGGVGIHGRHLDVSSRVQYVAVDRQRQILPQVEYLDDKGRKIIFSSTDANAAKMPRSERRVMDCMDCHNRPAHTFQLPDRAVDQSIDEGLISPDLPFIKKKATEVLKAGYIDREDASRMIAARLSDFYRASYPDLYREKKGMVDAAIHEIQEIYLRNVFPAMDVKWGTYPNNLGHTDFPGCFRCHDESHSTTDGRTISNDCDACHSLLAVDEPNPKVMSELEMK